MNFWTENKVQVNILSRFDSGVNQWEVDSRFVGFCCALLFSHNFHADQLVDCSKDWS